MSIVQPGAPIVIAMLKAPRQGFVKTRLAREIGAEPAVGIYRRLVEHQLAAIPPEWRFEVHFAPADAEREMRDWLGVRPNYHAQIGEDLGERLRHAFGGAFDRGAKAVLAIGGDCPELDEATLRKAWRAARHSDVVLGPARDGGYYLIGLRRPLPGVFNDIPWSSPAVLTTTIQRVHEVGLSYSMLAVKEDVDDLPSWRRLQALLPAVANAAGPIN